MLTVEGRGALKKVFEEVAERAFRLREWITYQDKLRPVQNSFNRVVREADSGINLGGLADQAVFTRIKDSWNACRTFEILTLQIFHEGVNYIDKPLNSGIGPALKVKYDVKKILDLREQIDVDFSKVAVLDLKQHCLELEGVIQFQLANILTAVAMEMQDLCALTRQVYDNFSSE